MATQQVRFPKVANEIRNEIMRLLDANDPVIKISGEEILQYAADILAHLDRPFDRESVVAVLLTIFECGTVHDEKLAQFEHYRKVHAPKIIATILRRTDGDTQFN